MHDDTQPRIPLIIGHRGASRDAPENTMAAFQLAWSQGADGIEADFRLTADGEIVCMHDATTGRTTDADLVIADATLARLRCLDAGSWKGPEWCGARIPTLGEILAALPSDSWFNIEIKCGPEIVAPLAAVLKTSGTDPGRIRLLSFNAPLITELRQALPEWHACWLCDYRTPGDTRHEVLATLHRVNACGLASADRDVLDADFSGLLRENGMEIHVWTVDTAVAARRLQDLAVDSIMTNRPGWLRRHLTRGI